MDNVIFVFGSNLQGIHGSGAALEAKQKWGAVQGQGVGFAGNSYAIPTKRTPYETLPLFEINEYIKTFVDEAAQHPNLSFIVTAIGCGLAGYKPPEIWSLFPRDLPRNVFISGELLRLQ